MFKLILKTQNIVRIVLLAISLMIMALNFAWAEEDACVKAIGKENVFRQVLDHSADKKKNRKMYDLLYSLLPKEDKEMINDFIQEFCIKQGQTYLSGCSGIGFTFDNVDINNDKRIDIIATHYFSGYCGSMGCPVYLYIKNKEGNYAIKYLFNGSNDFYISNNSTNGYRDIYTCKASKNGVKKNAEFVVEQIYRWSWDKEVDKYR